MHKPIGTVTLLCVIMLLYTYPMYSQIQVWYDNDSCDVIHNTKISYMPPVIPSMPYQVLAGYVAMDSIFRTASYDALLSRAMTMPKDSIEMGIRFWFYMKDYNPLLFGEYWKAAAKRSDYLISPSQLQQVLRKCYFERFGIWSNIAEVIIGTDYILHVRVIGQSSYQSILPTLGYEAENYCARVEFIEKVTGQILPNACQHNNAGDEEPPECLNIGWARIALSQCTTYDDSLQSLPYGPDLMEIGKEYLVFLNLGMLSNIDEGTSTYNVGQSTKLVRKNWVLPIENGTVTDKENVFGWGGSVPVETFKQYIHESITEAIGR